MNDLARWLILGSLLFCSSACGVLPQTHQIQEMSWPREHQTRDLYQGEGVYVLATDEQEAALGLLRYRRMLEDLEQAQIPHPGHGVLLILGQADDLGEPRAEALVSQLVEMLGDAGQALQGSAAWQLFQENLSSEAQMGGAEFEYGDEDLDSSEWEVPQEPMESEQALSIMPMLLDLERLLPLLHWVPQERPRWGLIMATGPRARAALQSMLETQMKAQGVGLMKRSLVGFALTFMENRLRKQSCTRLLVEAAFSHLSVEERLAMQNRL